MTTRKLHIFYINHQQAFSPEDVVWLPENMRLIDMGIERGPGLIRDIV
jgi:hypothetical protein